MSRPHRGASQTKELLHAGATTLNEDRQNNDKTDTRNDANDANGVHRFLLSLELVQ